MHDARAYAAPPTAPSTSSAWGSTTTYGAPDRPPLRAVPAPGATDRGHLTYAPGLDGVRALAVTAVVAFHLGAPWLTGGFLGVDVFFTLSGFLITSLLLAEFHARGHIDIKRFYLRRARRLLPALATMLCTVTALTCVVARGELHRLRGDVVSALTYCTNWTQIAWGRSYFAQLGRPSLLQHLWSLAVEEQFYLLWPVVLLACLAVRRRPWFVLAVPVAAAVASLVLMAVLIHPGQDPARVYYGSDTHIAPMLVGAAVAVTAAMRRRAGLLPDRRVAADVLALIGAAGLGWAFVRVDYYTAGLYRGGYLLVALASAALIHGAGRSGTLTARLLGTSPLVWIGHRSYAIYLWHWPILMLTRPGVDITWPRPVVVALQLAWILVAADLSYRLVERPIRAEGFVAFLRRPRRRRARTVPVLVAVLAVAGLVTAPPPSAGIQVDTSATPTVHVSIAPVRNGFARPVDVSFFGDSQGMTLLLNKPNGLDKVLRTSDSTVEGCGTMTGVIHSRTGYTRDLGADCAAWRSDWRRSVRQRHPQIAVVELGAWDVFDETVGGKRLAFGAPAWDAYFGSTLHQGIDILTGAGAQVALLEVPCYRPVAAGGLPRLPERGDDTRTRHLNVLLRAAAAAQPQRVFTVRPPAAFCTDPRIANDVGYRWDGTHFYKPGAALMFRVITPELLAIPPPPR